MQAVDVFRCALRVIGRDECSVMGYRMGSRQGVHGERYFTERAPPSNTTNIWLTAMEVLRRR